MSGDRARLASHLSGLSDARVLCVGDVMLDRYIYGTVERISPEGPIPVLRIGRESRMLGGAGNVVRNFAALGAKGAFVAVVGDDEAGGEIAALLAATLGVDAHLVTEAGRPTTIKTRFVAGTQQLLRADSETSRPVGEEARAAILEHVERALADCAVVALSEYGKGVLPPELIARIIERARERGRPVVVDPKGPDFSRYRGADVITPNRAELALATGMPVATEKEVTAAARRLMKRSSVAAVLATRGPDGMILVEGGRGTQVLHAEAREVFDVSGAGDTVVATVSAALAAGVPLGDAARLANTAASIVVGKTGTAVAGAGEIHAALHAQELMSGEAKVAALSDALARIADWRQHGLRVAFTNGCFDLLHPGHVALLAQAKAACDRLVVGLNSDASVTRLKGAGRPIQGEAARAVVLGALETVDLVIVFAEDTPTALLEAIRPDLLVKGADYRMEDVVGADFVRSYGGEVRLAPLEPGHSTTATIRRMAE